MFAIVMFSKVTLNTLPEVSLPTVIPCPRPITLFRNRMSRAGLPNCRPSQSRPDFTWEKQVPSARGFKRIGRHSEYPI